MTVAIGAGTWPKLPTLNTYGEANPSNDQYRPGGQDCDPSILAAIRNRRQRTRQSDACAKEAEEYRQNTNDLIQQTRAANAAEAQANIASQQLWSVWLQTLGGFLTLVAAVGAAMYARSAAAAAEKALHGLERPILQVRVIETGAGVYGRPDYKPLIFCLDNMGRAPAIILTVNAYLSVMEWGKRPNVGGHATRLSDRPWESVKEGQASSPRTCGAFSWPSEEFKDLAYSKWGAGTFFNGHVWYADLLGSEFVHFFNLSYNADENIFVPVVGWHSGEPANPRHNSNRKLSPWEIKNGRLVESRRNLFQQVSDFRSNRKAIREMGHQLPPWYRDLWDRYWQARKGR